jgi:hypothetical protein
MTRSPLVSHIAHPAGVARLSLEAARSPVRHAAP